MVKLTLTGVKSNTTGVLNLTPEFLQCGYLASTLKRYFIIIIIVVFMEHDTTLNLVDTQAPNSSFVYNTVKD